MFFSLAFLLGFLARGVSGVPRLLPGPSVSRTLVSYQSPGQGQASLQPRQSAHYTHTPAFSISTAKPEFNQLKVTKPRKLYRLSDLVPPSFYLGGKSYDLNAQTFPVTYQSFLVRKHNLRPAKYISFYKKTGNSSPPPPPPVPSPTPTNTFVNDGQGKWILTEPGSELSWSPSSDWTKHWIEQ